MLILDFIVICLPDCITTNFLFEKRNKWALCEMCLPTYADSEGPDQPAHQQSDQGLHCLLTE